MSLPISSPQERPAVRPFAVAVFVAVVATMRLLAAHFGELTEGDEILIADAVATIGSDGLGPIYRYGPQLGYYRVVLWLSGALGGPAGIPIAMVLLSALAGIAIPVFGLFAFRDTLSVRERLLLGMVLTLNPALWTAATYGNTAMPSVALMCAAVTLLSNTPGRRVEFLALLLFAGAILMRADAVLATGAIGLLLWHNHKSAMAAFIRVAAVGMSLLGLYGVLFAADPLMAGTLETVGKHLTNEFPTLFWDLLLWAFSPIPLAFAILGLREMEPRRRWLLATVVAWVLPFFAFYFGNTTTPRYHLQAVFPLSVATAIGIWAFTELVTRWRRVVTAATLAAVFAHAFVAVGRYVPGKPRDWLHGGSVGTHDGAFSTGGFVYKTFWWGRPHISRHLTTRYTLPAAARRWVDELATDRYAGRHVVVIADGIYSPMLHWAAQLRRAEVTAYHPRDQSTTCHQFELGLAGARVTTSDLSRLRQNESCRLVAQVGDEVWIVRPQSSAGTTLARARLASGLDLERIPGGDDMLHRYRITNPS
jgi:hypothetical protein